MLFLSEARIALMPCVSYKGNQVENVPAGAQSPNLVRRKRGVSSTAKVTAASSGPCPQASSVPASRHACQVPWGLSTLTASRSSRQLSAGWPSAPGGLGTTSSPLPHLQGQLCSLLSSTAATSQPSNMKHLKNVTGAPTWLGEAMRP